MKLTFVVAVAKNRVIGSHNSIPWYIPEDLKHFKDATIGKPVLMGKNTFDSIVKHLGKPLPDRKNIVVSRDPGFLPTEGVVLYRSLEEALERLKNEPEVMVAGGGQIYAQLINKADKLMLTEVHKEIDGDVLFPEYDKSEWRGTKTEGREELFRGDHATK